MKLSMNKKKIGSLGVAILLALSLVIALFTIQIHDARNEANKISEAPIQDEKPLVKRMGNSNEESSLSQANHAHRVTQGKDGTTESRTAHKRTTHDQGKPQSAKVLLGQPHSVPSNLAIKGEPVEGTVSQGENTFPLFLNQLSHFQKVTIEPGVPVAVSLTYPQGSRGEKAIVQVQDGGFIDGKDFAKQLVLDEDNTIRFNYTSTTDRGVYRVIVRRGSDIKVLQFWVGEPWEIRGDPMVSVNVNDQNQNKNTKN